MAEQVDQELPDVLIHRTSQAHRGGDRGERVVQQHHHRGFTGDVGARGAHRHADVSAFESGRVVRPVSGNRDDLAPALQHGDDPHLVFRTDPAQQQLRRAGQHLAQGAVVQGIELGPGHHRRVRLLHDAHVAGDRLGGQRVVAGHHDDADPGPPAGAHRVDDLWPRRVAHGDQPQEGQARLRVVLRDVGAVDLPPGDRQHAKSLRRHLIARSRHRRAQLVGERTAVTIPADVRAPGQQLGRRALDVGGVAAVGAVDGAHQLAGGVERELRDSGGLGLLRRQVQSGLRRSDQQGALGRVAEHPPAVPARRRQQPGVAAQGGRPQRRPDRARIGDLAGRLVPDPGHRVQPRRLPRPG